MYYDIHTHQVSSSEEKTSITNIVVRGKFGDEMGENSYYSCGIHPWYIDDIQRQFTKLSALAILPQVIALGEAGLDKLAETELSVQTEVFRMQVELSEKVQKPLIIHCVKAWDELFGIRKALSPRMPWIIHGFRGNGQLAEQLIQKGMFLSFGAKYNPEALSIAWPKSMLVETDESNQSIQQVYEQLAFSLNVPMELFVSGIAENSKRIFVCFK